MAGHISPNPCTLRRRHRGSRREAIRLVNSFGNQVVDTWALNRRDITEYLSVRHTRRMLFNLFPREGDKLFSNRRTPMPAAGAGFTPACSTTCSLPAATWLYQHYGCARAMPIAATTSSPR